jgi:alkylated DNA repair dioxygenase AlkB
MPEVVHAIAVRASELVGHPFDNCLCNLYETGRNAMGFHADSYSELVPDSFIAIASLGATRTLVFRSTDRVHRASYRLEHGSILIMDRATQTSWEHAIPRMPEAGLRVSLTFRQFRPHA